MPCTGHNASVIAAGIAVTRGKAGVMPSRRVAEVGWLVGLVTRGTLGAANCILSQLQHLASVS